MILLLVWLLWPLAIAGLCVVLVSELGRFRVASEVR